MGKVGAAQKFLVKKENSENSTLELLESLSQRGIPGDSEVTTKPMESEFFHSGVTL
jgi:hypothetical protein